MYIKTTKFLNPVIFFSILYTYIYEFAYLLIHTLRENRDSETEIKKIDFLYINI